MSDQSGWKSSGVCLIGEQMNPEGGEEKTIKGHACHELTTTVLAIAPWTINPSSTWNVYFLCFYFFYSSSPSPRMLTTPGWRASNSSRWSITRRMPNVPRTILVGATWQPLKFIPLWSPAVCQNGTLPLCPFKTSSPLDQLPFVVASSAWDRKSVV